MEELMKRLVEFSAICIVTFALVGCFPSQNLYRVIDCENCDQVIHKNAELAFIKETSGEDWRLWQRQSSGLFNQLCTGTVDGSEFSCDACGPGKTFTAKKTSSSNCDFDHCLKIDLYGPNCPSNGSGKGGHN